MILQVDIGANRGLVDDTVSRYNSGYKVSR